MKINAVFPIMITLVASAAAETKIVGGAATLSLPDRFEEIKRTTGDEGGVTVTVRDRKLDLKMTLSMNDFFLSILPQPSEEDLSDMEHFEREPGKWLGYQLIVLNKGESRWVEARHPAKRALFRVMAPIDTDFRPILEALKSIKVELTKGWTFIPTKSGRSFSLYPPGSKGPMSGD